MWKADCLLYFGWDPKVAARNLAKALDKGLVVEYVARSHRFASLAVHASHPGLAQN
jgi:hypothetical protein